MNGKQLRASILQEAIAGRLVPQDPNDEPASELLKSIREEKARLVKEGKLPKEKNETLIFRGDDKKFYEQKGKTVTCIDDQIPFEIPDSWAWCRLGNIGDWGAGATPYKSEPKYYGGDILWLRTGELNNGVVYDTEIKITEKALKECSLRMAKEGDVLVAMYCGPTIGNVAIAGKEMTTNQACCACTPLGIYNYYLFYFLMASKADLAGKGAGGVQSNISKEKLVNHLIPIPPLAEQKRIVEKIEELMPLVDEYEKAQEEFDNLNAGLKGKLRTSLLQEAIAGRLVPQDPHDEPACELLHRINPKATPLETDQPLPEGWCATTVSVICKMTDGKFIKDRELVTLDAKVLRGQQDGNRRKSGKLIPAKSLLILVVGENSGEVFRTPIDGYQGASFKKLDINENMHEEFVLKVLNSHHATLKKDRKGTATPFLKRELFREMQVPIPPLAEQKRIVEKLESMFAVLDNLDALTA